MSRSEAPVSKRNISGFFRNGSSYEVEFWAKTRKGQRLFLFHNKFVHSGSGKKEIYLIFPGTDITEERRAQEDLRVCWPDVWRSVVAGRFTGDFKLP